MKCVQFALTLWLAVSPAAFAADNAATKALAGIAGLWQGSGTTSDMPSRQRLHWEPVLDGKFLRLTLENRMTMPDGKEWQFRAQAYYRAEDDGRITGTWFDSRGYTFPLLGTVDEAGVIAINWGSDDTERGRSRYRLAGSTLEVTDEVQDQDGTLRVFGRSTLTRTP